MLEIAGGRAEIARLGREKVNPENTIVERTKWAQSFDEKLQRSRAEPRALEKTTLDRTLQLIPGKSE